MTPRIERGMLATLLLTLVALCGGVFSARGQEPRKIDLKPVMEQKLKHSQALLEGLAQEDFVLIRDRARVTENRPRIAHTDRAEPSLREVCHRVREHRR